MSETKIISKCVEIKHLKNGGELRSHDCLISKHIDALEIYIPELKRTIAIKVEDAKSILDQEG